MLCQTLTKNNIEFIKNKRIGRVIFVVEGNKTEILLLKRIFVDILGYNFISENRVDQHLKFVSNKDNYSVVYVMNSKNSNINSITDPDVLSEEIHDFLLANDNDFALSYASIFYIFDRDYKSNPNHVVEHLIDRYKYSRDENDDYTLQGLLLLSYPCIEAFLMECLVKNYDTYLFDMGKPLKNFLGKRKKTINKINEDNILTGVSNTFNNLVTMDINTINLDNFHIVNKSIFDYEENHLLQNDSYKLISLISIALLDLGLLKVK